MRENQYDFDSCHYDTGDDPKVYDTITIKVHIKKTTSHNDKRSYAQYNMYNLLFIYNFYTEILSSIWCYSQRVKLGVANQRMSNHQTVVQLLPPSRSSRDWGSRSHDRLVQWTQEWTMLSCWTMVYHDDWIFCVSEFSFIEWKLYDNTW